MIDIHDILKAEIPEDLIPDLNHFDKYYKEAIVQIHPDVNKTAESTTATQKINMWYNDCKMNKKAPHDLGTINYSWFQYNFNTTYKTAEQYSNDLLKKFQSDTKLAPYFPKTPTQFFHNRCVPITSLSRPLPIEHVNWIVSRLLEGALYINQLGYVHAGFTPSNIFVCPANHSIQIMSSIHTVKMNTRLKTISAEYKNMYSSIEQATPDIDIQMIKQIGLMLLGDNSGIGTMFRKVLPPDLLAFYQQVDTNTATCYMNYRNLLTKLFPKKFFKLIF